MSNWIEFSFKEIEWNEELNKKELKGLPKWSELKQSDLKKEHKNKGIITGSKSKLLIMDIDKGQDCIDELNKRFPELKNVPCVKTNKGCHYYFNWDDKYSVLRKDYASHFGEILKDGQFAICPPSSYTKDGKTIKYEWIKKPDNNEYYLSNELYEWLFNIKESKNDNNKTIKIKKNKKDVKNTYMPDLSIIDDDYWIAILNNINRDKWDYYPTWFQLLCALDKLGEDLGKDFKKVAMELSKTSNKFDINEFNEVWNKVKNHKHSYSGGTIKYYSRESNNENYVKINKNKHGCMLDLLIYNEEVLKNYFMESFGDNIISCKKTIYVYHREKWKKDKKGSIIKTYILDIIKELYKVIINECNNNFRKALERGKEGEEDVKMWKTREDLFYKYMCGFGNTKINNLWGIISDALSSNDIDDEIFDLNDYLFAFSNIAYDFTINDFRKIDKFDYVLLNTNREWSEPTQEQNETIKKVFEDIFPDEDDKKCYISILKSGLVGLRLDKFIVASGSGGNGKTVVNDLYKVLLGDYYKTVSLILLTKELKTDNPTLATIHNVRFLKFTEPDNGALEKLRISNIKTITGESTFQVRGLYQEPWDMTFKQTTVIECNTLPTIDFEGNDAEARRFEVMPFKSKFTNDEDLLNIENAGYKLANKKYTEESWRLEYRCALFKYIVDNTKDNKDPRDIYITKNSKKLTQDWFNANNTIYNWFIDIYVYKENAVINMKDLYWKYKESDLYGAGTKAERKKMTYKYFNEEFIKNKLKNVNPKIKWLEKDQYFNGKKMNCLSLGNYTLIRECNINSSDDEEVG
tara:strand:- start:39 stop:2453 length:2415 start_codon:yes stop_codon:yes gene_type:complete